MAGGRPTKYKIEYTQDLIDFFEQNQVNETGGKRMFPTMARFACNLETHQDTLRNWAKAEDENGELKHPEFFEAYKRAKEYQEAFIYEGAFSGAVNPTFAIWSAKAILGHRDGDNEKHEDIAKPLSISFTVEDARKDA